MMPAAKEPVTSNLRPGAFCRIEMRLPPSASYSSYQRYAGTIHEVTDEEIVLVQATEDSKVEYGSAHRRSPSSQARDAIRVPIAGIASIQVSDPSVGSIGRPVQVRSAKVTRPDSLRRGPSGTCRRRRCAMRADCTDHAVRTKSSVGSIASSPI